MTTIPMPKEDVEKLSAFVATATPVMSKHASVLAAIEQDADEVLDLLVDRGIIAPSMKQSKLAELKADPAALVSEWSKCAKLIAPLAMGQAANQRGGKSAGADQRAESDRVYEETLEGKRG